MHPSIHASIHLSMHPCMHPSIHHATIHFTGGYVNPALTLAFCLCGRIPWKKLPIYSIAQVCGAFLAAFAVYVVYYGKFGYKYKNVVN